MVKTHQLLIPVLDSFSTDVNSGQDPKDRMLVLDAAPALQVGMPERSCAELASTASRSPSEAAPLISSPMSQSVLSCENSPVEDGIENHENGHEQANWQFIDQSLGQFLEPLFDTPGEQIAFMYYIKHLAGIISPRDDDQNPYRKLATFAIGNPVLLHTLVSISTEWMLRHGHSNAKLASDRQSKALMSIKGLISSMEQEQAEATRDSEGRGRLLSSTSQESLRASREAALSAVLMQIAHAMFSGSSGGQAHVQCAYYLLDQLGYTTQLHPSFLPRMTAQRFAIADVAASLLHATRPKAPLTFPLYQVNEDLDKTEPSFCRMTGCPQPVLSVLAHIAHLSCDLRETRHEACAETETEATLRIADRLDFTLRSWGFQRHSGILCQHPGRPLSELAYDEARDKPLFGTTGRYHLALLKECFYWLAHLLLQRRIYRDPRSSRRVQQTVKRALALMKAISPDEKLTTALPLPFYLVARDCADEDDRTWIRAQHQRMRDLYRTGARDNWMRITEQIWGIEDEKQKYRAGLCGSKRDQGVAEDSQNETLLEHHFSLLF